MARRLTSNLPDPEPGFMRLALQAAARVKGSTFPNPAVGAVLVKKGKVIATGATAPAGGPHAEVAALRQAGQAAAGSTLYVTFEPCCHHGRTPPCTDFIRAAGVKEVVASLRDPNPLVDGGGFRALRKAGIKVRTGLLATEARRLNEDYFHALETGRAFVTLKLALTLDGRIADTVGGSRWITNETALAFAHDLRRRHAAVAVGGGTLRQDDPRLDVRRVAGPSPARIIFSRRAGALHGTALQKTAGRLRTIVVKLAKGRGFGISRQGPVEIWTVRGSSPREQLRAFLRLACRQEIPAILLEGGRRMASAFLEHGLIDRVHLCFGNKIFGGGVPGLEFSVPRKVAHSLELTEIEFSALGDNVLVSGIPAASR